MTDLFSPKLLLTFAIIVEVLASASLAKSAGFTRLLPTVFSLVGYGIAFYCLSQVVKTIPLGITYAIWSGAGIVLTAVIGYIWLGNRLDMPAVLGMGLIIAGVIVINIFSKTAQS